MKPLILGSRGSPLALAQTRLVQAGLERAWPDARFELRVIRTEGDRRSGEPATASSAPPGKGIFTAELERALLRGEIDLAVHSLKDLPVEDPAGILLGAIPRRADARDVLITRAPMALTQLPPGAALATGSPRRAAQLRLLRPDLRIEPIRGNIDTRLRKFRENPAWDGLILAAAGLERLRPDLDGLATLPLPFSAMLPAPGQGALAVQVRAGDAATARRVAVLHDPATAVCVGAERAFLRTLGGGCDLAAAAHATLETDDRLHLAGIAWLDGETAPRRGETGGPIAEADRLGQALARQLARRASPR